MKKNESFIKPIKFGFPFLVLLVCVALVFVAFLFKLPLFLLAPLVGFIIIIIVRLFSGRPRATEGDIVLFWGFQGSGKTMFISKTARYLKKEGWHIAGNNEFAQVFPVDYVFEKYHMGNFRPLEHTAYFIDEASLSGYDSRDFARNFSREGILNFWKKVRHNSVCIFMTNQGWNEIDIKIRESLTKTIYYVENKGKYSVAVRMDKSGDFDYDTGVPVEGFTFPSLWDRIKDPSCQIYVWHSAEGKNYSTLNPDPLPFISDIDDYIPVLDKYGIPYKYIKKKIED